MARTSKTTRTNPRARTRTPARGRKRTGDIAEPGRARARRAHPRKRVRAPHWPERYLDAGPPDDARLALRYQDGYWTGAISLPGHGKLAIRSASLMAAALTAAYYMLQRGRDL